MRRAQVPSFARGRVAQDFSPGHIVRSAEASLRRLRRDRLDLYQLHSPPADVLRSGDFLEPLERLKAAGKIRYYGVSCEDSSDAELALRYAGVSTIQVRLSILAQYALVRAVPAAAECRPAGYYPTPLAVSLAKT